MTTSTTIEPAQENDFSLVQGGPIFQLFLRSHLTTSALGWLKRRIMFFIVITWLPLLLLTTVSGQALSGSLQIPFLHDLEAHVRFLLALPLLLVAEWVVHQKLPPIIGQFVERGIITSGNRPAFDTCIAVALRLRNSVAIEIMLIALVYTLGHAFFFDMAMLKVSTWYAAGSAQVLSLSPAGYWLGYVSLPIYQFLLLRWCFRIMVLAFFLWRVSRLELDLVPTHPDRAAGLGFLGQCAVAFVPLLLSQGALLSGMIAERILFQGDVLTSFKAEILVVTVFLLLLVLGPLCVFAPQLARIKRKGLLDYGVLASRYVRAFDKKWVKGEVDPHERLLGTGDIQSLADLNNSIEVIRNMQILPFNRQTVAQILLATLLPLLPLLLTMISLEDLLKRLIGILL